MGKPKVAFLTIAESREKFYEKRKALLSSECRKFCRAFSKEMDILESEPIQTVPSALLWTDRVAREQADAVIIHIPVWASPNLATKIVSNLELPVAILGNLLPTSSSFGCMLAVAGAMGQIGKKAKRIIGDIDDAGTRKEVLQFAYACHAIQRLRRSSYCLFGGRSLGIVTTQADFSAWERDFGVDCDQKDQYEIVRRAESIDSQRTQKYLDWLKANAGDITYSGIFTPLSLRRQINCYLAVKDIVGECAYDFISIKCQQELSDGYALQCPVIAMLNDNYDAEGYKKAIPCACEGDNDGALTMEILSLIGGGMPSSLMDIRLMEPDKDELILANCGGAPTYYAGRSSDPRENLKQVYLMEHVFGDAGGAAVQFVCAKGPVTLARLFRVNSHYRMGLLEGEFQAMDREELRKTTYCYPHGFVKAKMDFRLFAQTMGTNHIHTLPGHCKDTLKTFCDILDIPCIDYNV